jgi:hypothetical protein
MRYIVSPLDCHIKDVSIIQNSIIQIVMNIMKQVFIFN